MSPTPRLSTLQSFWLVPSIKIVTSMQPNAGFRFLSRVVRLHVLIVLLHNSATRVYVCSGQRPQPVLPSVLLFFSSRLTRSSLTFSSLNFVWPSPGRILTNLTTEVSMDYFDIVLSWLTWPTTATFLLCYLTGLACYRLFIHPLARFPGPKLAAVTRWFEAYYDVVQNGRYTFKIQEMHKKYGILLSKATALSPPL